MSIYDNLDSDMEPEDILRAKLREKQGREKRFYTISELEEADRKQKKRIERCQMQDYEGGLY